jgi:DNA repair protein RadC
MTKRWTLHDDASDEEVIAHALAILRLRMRRGDALTSPTAVRQFLALSIGERDREVFVVLFLDAQHRVIAHEEMFLGTLQSTTVTPREIARAAMKHNAGSVILAHNHPSGVAEPSASDQLLTDSIKAALALVDVRVLDHVLVGGSSVLSFAERGLL